MNFYHIMRRHVCSVSTIRDEFLKFFNTADHKLIPSSPVVPYNDPSLTFVNAGMNQFKTVFQGLSDPPAPRAANSQRCVRVGGKHNDLAVVGTDGTHLTMFEMLGSWSFGDYWKEEACKMALQLLTESYGLDKERLWFTYFGGCEKLGLDADTETREIWRQLGVSNSKIHALGLEDNFWEMGLSGPCGPCTEIHYNNRKSSGLSGATEIWNIVFMQFNRNVEGELEPLAVKHIDTGMGLERLAAMLNMGKEDGSSTLSLYNTDVFSPLFDHISSVSGKVPYSGDFRHANRLDWGYRVLADHARMLTVCMADGVFPHQNHRLKNVLRQAQKVSSDVFKVNEGMLQELSYKIVETVGSHHVDLQRNHQKVLTLLDFEDENFKRLRSQGKQFKSKLFEEYSTFAESVEDLDAVNYYEALKCVENENRSERINGQIAYKLYESHGLQSEDIAKVAAFLNLKYEKTEFEEYMKVQKRKSKMSTALLNSRTEEFSVGDIQPTNDCHKYHYERSKEGMYTFSPVSAKLLGLVNDKGIRVHSLIAEEKGVLFSDKTNFYSESGGQIGDKGYIKKLDGSVFKVQDVQKVSTNSQLIAHIGRVEAGQFSVHDNASFMIDVDHRMGCMRNHTATHLLNSVLNEVLPLTCQRSSQVTADFFKFDFSVFNIEFDNQLLKRVEDNVRSVIAAGTSIKRHVIPSEQLVNIDNLVVLPGEVYPSEVTIINTSNHCEPCCGTHLLNTRDIVSFVVIEVKAASSGVKSLKCLTGENALNSIQKGNDVSSEVHGYRNEVDIACGGSNSEKTIMMDKITNLLVQVSHPLFPASVANELEQILEEYRYKIKLSQRAVSKLSAVENLKTALKEQESHPFFSYYMCLPETDKFSLSKAAKAVEKTKPCILFSQVKGEVKGKALVPKEMVSSTFSAKLWLEIAAELLGSKVSAPRGQNEDINCNMTGIRNITDDQINEMMTLVRQFAKKNFPS